MGESPSALIPPRIVVSGAGGFIGRHVMAALRVAGISAIGVDVQLPPPNASDAWTQALLPDAPILTERPFVLVHLAWNMVRGNPDAQTDSVALFCELLAHPNLRAVVGLGSAEEYGATEGRLSASDAPGPHLSAYGQAKHDAFRSLFDWTRRVGSSAFWLRPFIVYGEGQRGDMVIPYALRCAANRVPADLSDGVQFRDFVHVADVASAIVAAVRNLSRLAPGETRVCNLGRGEPVRLRDLLERIADRADARALFHFGARSMRPGEPTCQYADVTAAESALSWQAAVSWQDGIDRLCRAAHFTEFRS